MLDVTGYAGNPSVVVPELGLDISTLSEAIEVCTDSTGLGEAVSILDGDGNI